jgi:hypothetical protein
VEITGSESACLVVAGTRLVAIRELSSSSIVFGAFAVTISPEDLAAAHIVVPVAASEGVCVLAGFLRLTHGSTSRVEDMR